MCRIHDALVHRNAAASALRDASLVHVEDSDRIVLERSFDLDPRVPPDMAVLLSAIVEKEMKR